MLKSEPDAKSLAPKMPCEAPVYTSMSPPTEDAHEGWLPREAGSGVRGAGAGRGSCWPDGPVTLARWSCNAGQGRGAWPMPGGHRGPTRGVQARWALPRVVVSIARPQLSSCSLGRKGAGGLGACESGWEAGVTLVLSPRGQGPAQPQPAPCALGRPALPIRACHHLRRVDPR